jgi:hypothetical protein
MMTQETVIFSIEAVKPKVLDFLLDNRLFRLNNLDQLPGQEAKLGFLWGEVVTASFTFKTS